MIGALKTIGLSFLLTVAVVSLLERFEPGIAGYFFGGLFVGACAMGVRYEMKWFA